MTQIVTCQSLLERKRLHLKIELSSASGCTSKNQSKDVISAAPIKKIAFQNYEKVASEVFSEHSEEIIFSHRSIKQ